MEIGRRGPKNEKKMPKLKTHTGAAKRFSKTGTGKIKRGQTKTRHILSSKSPKLKRKLGKTVLVSDGDYKKVARMIPYARVLRTVLVFWERWKMGRCSTAPAGCDGFPPSEKSGLHSE